SCGRKSSSAASSTRGYRRIALAALPRLLAENKTNTLEPHPRLASLDSPSPRRGEGVVGVRFRKRHYQLPHHKLSNGSLPCDILKCHGVFCVGHPTSPTQAERSRPQSTTFWKLT